MTEEYLISLLWAARKKNRLLQRALEKAEHDRERYARRIRLLQGGQAILSRELRALRAEREIQGKCLQTLEGRLAKTMTVKEYQFLAARTINQALDEKELITNGAMGLCGESGEVIDLVKKWRAQGHELDRVHLTEELGDVAWYLAETATAIGAELEDVLKANIEKLMKRYPEGFAAERSVNREEYQNRQEGEKHE